MTQRSDVARLSEIGIALAEERDIGALLDRILRGARELTGSDAGSLYLVAGAKLYFKLAHNDSVAFSFKEIALPITPSSVAGYVALERKPLVLRDAYRIPASRPYRFAKTFDEATGYRTCSMLAVPMQTKRGDLLGVLQLINRRVPGDKPLGPGYPMRRVRGYEPQEVDLAMSLAAQAAVSLENRKLYEEIRGLFDSFVRASVGAVESRDPTTSGHSERVARYTVSFGRALNEEASGAYSGVRFSADDLRQLEYAGILHDFGKIGVREAVLVKANKLYPHELERIENRGREIRLRLQMTALQRRLETVVADRKDLAALQKIEADISREIDRVERDLELVRKANAPTVTEEGVSERLQALARERLNLPGCDILTLLDEEEARRLGIRRGSLTAEERREIESHVTHTYNYLKMIPWTKDLQRVPDIAHAHHEKMDGTGYPRGLKGPDIPLEARMMTICDIYDALTAWDRPYKKAIPRERALAILEDESKRGAVDGGLLEVFLRRRVFESVPEPLPAERSAA